MYNKDYYKKNKKMFLEWQRKYRLLHKEHVQQNRRRYDSKNRIRINELKKQWRLKNNQHYKAQKSKDDVKYYQKHKERILVYAKQHSQLPHIKARRSDLARIWRKNNPRSNRSLYPELQEAMNNVRIRDKNTCQWQGCGLKHKATQVHVNHIFPRSEYPDLELIEQYMICYCVEHHAQFHAARGDVCSKLILPRNQEEERLA